MRQLLFGQALGIVTAAILFGCGARTSLDRSDARGGSAASSSSATGGAGGGGADAGGALWFVPIEPDLSIDPILLGADAAGNAYVATGFEPDPVKPEIALHFGGPVTCAPTSSKGVRSVVAKFDATGQRARVNCFAAEGLVHSAIAVNALAVGPAGDVAIVGEFGGTVDFGGVTISSADGAEYLALFDPSGAPRFAVQAEGDDFSWGAAVDGAGRVVLAGVVTPTLPFALPPGATGLFVASFEADGTLAWSHAYGGVVGAAAVAIGPDGGIAIGEIVTQGIDGWPAMPGPTASPYVVVTDASGNVAWTAAGRGIPGKKKLPPMFGGDASNIVFAGAHVVAGGIQYAPIDFGAGKLGEASSLFAAALDEPGNVVWQKSAMSNGSGLLAGDGADRLVMAGNAEAGNSFEGVSCGGGGYCILLASFDANGNATGRHAVSAAGLPGTADAALVSGAAFGQNMLFVTGSLGARTVDFGGGAIKVRRAGGFLAALPE